MASNKKLMDFLFITCVELDALRELPLSQRVVYMMGIRPYMDRKTLIAGIKRKISYQGLRETLYVAPIPGVKTGSPSHPQMKRAVKSLARAGLIEIQSSTKNLIVKCILADARTPEQIQDASNSTPEQDTKLSPSKPTALISLASPRLKTNRSTHKAIPPHDSDIDHQNLYQKFELFWQNYPLPTYKSRAWEAFKKINPDDGLFELIMRGLHQQMKQKPQSKSNVRFVAIWADPAEWLAQACWRQS